MKPTIEYWDPVADEWFLGVLHGFSNQGYAIVEQIATNGVIVIPKWQLRSMLYSVDSSEQE